MGFQSDIEDILLRFLDESIEELKGELRAQGKKVTGKTESLFSSRIERPFAAAMYGASYLETLIVGRGATKKSGSGGGETLRDRLKAWIKARSIKPDEPNMTIDSLAFVMARKMHEEGSLMFRLKQNTGLLDKVLTEQKFKALLDSFAGLAQVNLFTNLINETR